MKPQLKSSPAARELIQRFEPYREVAAQGSDGRWRVGFGHRAAAREGVRVSRDDASLLLIYDVMQAEAVIDEMFPQPLPKMQRDALTSFIHDIGATAFRNSDVARYLFEGRVEAAAEALASYGEGSADRREAESAMVLAQPDNVAASSMPARKPALVDLVIKVEHPVEDVRAASPRENPRPALPDSLMPPPPRMTRQAAARREAENEIARILATVGAMPLDQEPPQDAIPARDAPAEPVDELVEAIEPAAAAESVIEPVVEDMPAGDAGDAPKADVEPGPPGDIDMAAAMASPTALEVEAGNDADLVPAEASDETEAGEAEAGEPAPSTAAPVSAPVSAQVIARMSQEIALVQTVIIGREQRRALRPIGDEALPEGVSLGYVFTGSMRVGLVQQDETGLPAEPVAGDTAQSVTEPEPELQADVAASVETAASDARIEDVQPAERDVEPAAEAAPDAEPVDVVPAAAGIVERSLAVAGDEIPPPHPGDAHAPSQGAVGDIAAEAARDDSQADADLIAHADELAGTPGALMADSEGDDAFSPRDLVGSTDMFVDSKPAEARKEEGGWGFAVTLIAGLVVTGAGVLDVYGDWPRVWDQRDPTWGVMAAVAGSFLVVTASWMLWSVLAAKRRQNRSN